MRALLLVTITTLVMMVVMTTGKAAAVEVSDFQQLHVQGGVALRGAVGEDTTLQDAVQGKLGTSPPSSTVAGTKSPTGNSNEVLTLYAQMPFWAQVLAGIIFFILGFVVCFWGYAFLPLSMFVIVGFAASLIIWAILVTAISDSNPDKWTIVYYTSFGAWLVVGTLFACCTKLGLFFMGAGLGAILALVLNPICLRLVWPANPSANLIIWICVFGVALGVAAVCLERPLTILATGAGGANLMLMAVGMWMGDMAVVDVTTGGTTTVGWTFFGAFLALWLFGIVVQFLFTAPSSRSQAQKDL